MERLGLGHSRYSGCFTNQEHLHRLGTYWKSSLGPTWDLLNLNRIFNKFPR